MRKLPLNTPTPAHSALGVVGTGVEHDSAWLHTSGQARYIDDLPAPEGLVNKALRGRRASPFDVFRSA